MYTNPLFLQKKMAKVCSSGLKPCLQGEEEEKNSFVVFHPVIRGGWGLHKNWVEPDGFIALLLYLTVQDGVAFVWSDRAMAVLQTVWDPETHTERKTDRQNAGKKIFCNPVCGWGDTLRVTSMLSVLNFWFQPTLSSFHLTIHPITKPCTPLFRGNKKQPSLFNTEPRVEICSTKDGEIIHPSDWKKTLLLFFFLSYSILFYSVLLLLTENSHGEINGPWNDSLNVDN